MGQPSILIVYAVSSLISRRRNQAENQRLGNAAGFTVEKVGRADCIMGLMGFD